MSIVGFDLGNGSCRVAILRNGGGVEMLSGNPHKKTEEVLDVLTYREARIVSSENSLKKRVRSGDSQKKKVLSGDSCRKEVLGDNSHRKGDVHGNKSNDLEIPTMVGFGKTQRHFGADARHDNAVHCISQIKRLIGRRYSELEGDLILCPYVKQDWNDLPRLHLNYLGEDRTFTPTQLLAMILSNLKSIAEANLGTDVSHCYISIPAYFTYDQRNAVLEAASLAGLEKANLIHDMSALALSYQHEMNRKKPTNQYVVFVDIGYTTMQVCVAKYDQAEMSIISQSSDHMVGGKFIDHALFMHLVGWLKENSLLHDLQDSCTMDKLLKVCEGMKKTLTFKLTTEAKLPFLTHQEDSIFVLSKEDLEDIITPMLNQMMATLNNSIEESKVSNDNISCIIVSGLGSKVPALMRKLKDTFGEKVEKSKNLSGGVARGCALRCAIESSDFQSAKFKFNGKNTIQNYKVKENSPFTIECKFVSYNKQYDPDPQTRHGTIFCTEDQMPIDKSLTFPWFYKMIIEVYQMQNDVRQILKTIEIGPNKPSKDGEVTLEVILSLQNGTVSVKSVTIVEAVELPATIDSTDLQANIAQKDCSGYVASTDPDKKSIPKGNEDKAVPMFPIIEKVNRALGVNELEEAKQEELKMVLRDSLVYKLKRHYEDAKAYAAYASSVDTSNITGVVNVIRKNIEDGEDKTKEWYDDMIKELEKACEPVKKRYKEHVARTDAHTELVNCLINWIEHVWSNDARLWPFKNRDVLKLVENCTTVGSWLDEQMEKLRREPMNVDPAFRSSEIIKKTKELKNDWSWVTSRRPAQPARSEAKPPIALEHETLVFNVVRGNFNTFINTIRDRLSDNNEFGFIGRSRHLCYQTPHGQPNKALLLKLIGEKGKSVTIGVRTDNGNFFGFTNKNSQWFQIIFSQEGAERHSEDLSQVKQERTIYMQRDYLIALSQRLTELNLGEKFAIKDVNVLWDFEPKNRVDIDPLMEEAITRISITFLKSPLLFPLSDALYDGWKEGTRLTDLLVQCILGWPDACAMLRALEAGTRYVIKDTVRAMNISSRNDALDVVCLVHLVKGAEYLNKKRSAPLLSPPPEASGHVNNNQRGTKALGDHYGQLLIHVFSASANFKLIGTIRVSDGWRTQQIYFAPPAPCFPEETEVHEIKLTGPCHAISAESGFCIEVDAQGDPGQALWNWSDSSKYDEPDMLTITTEKGLRINVTYVVLSDAVEANMQLKLKLPWSDSNYIHGCVTARINTFEQGSCLFSRGAQEGVTIPGVKTKIKATIVAREPVAGLTAATAQAPVVGLTAATAQATGVLETWHQVPIDDRLYEYILPLDRSTLAVPLGATLHIQGDLFCGDIVVSVNQTIELNNGPMICQTIKTPWADSFGCKSSVSVEVR